MDNTQAKLIGEQFSHLKDNIEARLQKLETDLNHENELSAERRNQTKTQLRSIHKILDDHENRIRTVDDAVIAQHTTGSLLQAGQAGLSLVLSAIAAWLGQR